MKRLSRLLVSFGPRLQAHFSAPLCLGFTASLAAVLLSLPLLDPHLSDVPLLLFMVPIALCAVRFGLRGGLGAAATGIVIELFWFLHDQRFGSGLVDMVSQISVFLLVGGIVGSVIETRQQLEQALETHYELSLDLICTASFDGCFTRVNPAGERLLGYTSGELCARPFFDFIHPDDREATLAELRRQTDAGLPVFNFQNRYQTKAGPYRWLEWMSRPDSNGKQLIAVARDITERKQAEAAIAGYRAQLEQSVRDRTRELEARTRELADARRETLRRLALAAEYRDIDTFDHTERVGTTAALIAQQLGLPETQIELIRLAAPLHDVGKLHVPDVILLKPGKLTPAEFEQVKLHTTAGAAILSNSNSDVLQLAEQIALSHHEWWNGNGYPHNLAGSQIPIAGRIVALADVFDALTHQRPYKPAWPPEEALNEVNRLSGQHFDPEIVAAFNRLNHAQLLIRRQHPTFADVA